MKKKYTTSLKLLLDDQSNYVSLNEGMSHLTGPNFSAQKAAKCDIDIPADIRTKALEYIEGAKSAADRDADAKKRAALAKKGEDPTIMPAAITNLLDYTQSFFGGAAKSLLDNEQNWSEFQKMLNMFYFNNAPAVYCDILNSLMKRLGVIIRALDANKPRDTGPETETVNIDTRQLTLIPLHEKYASDVILPKIFRNSNEYNNKLMSYQIDFFRSAEGKQMFYAMLHFENFSKEKLLNDKFDINYLNEDIINLQEIINEITGKYVDTSSVTSAFLEIADITEYSRKIKSAVNEKESIFEKFDDENEDSDDIAGEKAHKFFVNEYINYLLTVIQKIFYDRKLFNIMPNDCKDKFKQFISYLNSKMI